VSNAAATAKEGSMTDMDRELETLLCAGCTVETLLEPCSRCQKLLDSGQCRGPMPQFAIPVARYKTECWRCCPPRKFDSDPKDAKYCDACISSAGRARARYTVAGRVYGGRSVGEGGSR
jgi:hypothetical protein